VSPQDDKNARVSKTVSNQQPQLVPLAKTQLTESNISQQPTPPTAITKPNGENTAIIQSTLLDDKYQVPHALLPPAEKSPRNASPHLVLDIEHQSALLEETGRYVTPFRSLITLRFFFFFFFPYLYMQRTRDYHCTCPL